MVHAGPMRTAALELSPTAQDSDTARRRWGTAKEDVKTAQSQQEEDNKVETDRNFSSTLKNHFIQSLVIRKIYDIPKSYITFTVGRT